HLRKQAHARLGDPDGLNVVDAALVEDTGDAADPAHDADLAEALEELSDSVGLFEWSAVPGCSIWDRTGWAMANPSLGYGELTERNIASAASTDPEWEFRTEVL